MYPQFWHPFKNLITTASQYMILAVTIERYLVICHKRDIVLNPYLNTGTVLFFSLLISIPKFFEFIHINKEVQKNTVAELHESNEVIGKFGDSYEYGTSPIAEDPNFLIFNAYHEVFVIGFCLLTIFYCNYQICCKIKTSADVKNRYINKSLFYYI